MVGAKRSKIRMIGPSVQAVNLATVKPVEDPQQAGYGRGRGGRPWRRKRDAVMKRDRHQCQPCKRAGGLTEATQVDHIVPLAEGGTDDDTNLQAICGPCHDVKTAAESARALARARGRT